MKFTHNYYLLLISFFSVLYFVTSNKLAFSQTSIALSPFPYEAELEYYSNNKLSYRSMMLVKGLKYLHIVEYQSQPKYVLYRDDNPSGIHWHYDNKKRTATPNGSILIRILGKEARAKGIDYVMKHYNIPNSYRLTLMDAMTENSAYLNIHYYDSIPLFRHVLTDAQKQNLPIEIVAGHECYVNTHERQSDKVSSKSKSWIEKQSGLVLRSERTMMFRNTQNPREPSTSSTTRMTVTKFKLHKDIPDSKFQLPPGTIAYYPETMKGLKFPKGVIPKPMTGRAAKSGIDWEQVAADDKKVRTIPSP